MQPKTRFKGSAHASSKLTEDDVRDIRKRHKEESLTTSDLARIYSVTPQAIRSIIIRRTWKHVE